MVLNISRYLLIRLIIGGSSCRRKPSYKKKEDSLVLFITAEFLQTAVMTVNLLPSHIHHRYFLIYDGASGSFTASAGGGITSRRLPTAEPLVTASGTSLCTSSRSHIILTLFIPVTRNHTSMHKLTLPQTPADADARRRVT